jgi:hypothetical protein
MTRVPIIIVPDNSFRIADYTSVSVKMALGTFYPGTAQLSFPCSSLREYLCIFRMLAFLYKGEHPGLIMPGLTSADVLLQTSVTHELRHFHDSLLSFSLFEVLRRKLFMLVNMHEAFRVRAPGDPGQLMPVPLVQWLMLPMPERQKTTERLREFFGSPELSFCELPSFTQSEIMDRHVDRQHKDAAMLACSRAGVSIRTLLRGYYPRSFGLAAADVYELSAIAIQLLTIIDRFGIHIFQDIYSQCIVSSKWNDTLQQVEGVFDKLAPLPPLMRIPNALMLTAAMAFWAICAAPSDANESESVCPAARFEALRKKLLHGDTKISVLHLEQPEELLATFDRIMGEPIDTRGRVELATRSFTAFTEEVETLTKSWTVLPYQNFVLGYWKELVQIRKDLTGKAFDHLYLYLRGYFQHRYAYELTLPPVVIDGTRYSNPSADADERAMMKHVAGRRTTFRLADRINAHREALDWISAADGICSKLMFDETPLLYTPEEIEAGIRHVTGHRPIRLSGFA